MSKRSLLFAPALVSPLLVRVDGRLEGVVAVVQLRILLGRQNVRFVPDCGNIKISMTSTTSVHEYAHQ